MLSDDVTVKQVAHSNNKQKSLNILMLFLPRDQIDANCFSKSHDFEIVFLKLQGKLRQIMLIMV